MTNAEKAEMIINDAEVIAGGTKFALMVMAEWKKEQVIEEAEKWLAKNLAWYDLYLIKELSDHLKKYCYDK